MGIYTYCKDNGRSIIRILVMADSVDEAIKILLEDYPELKEKFKDASIEKINEIITWNTVYDRLKIE